MIKHPAIIPRHSKKPEVGAEQCRGRRGPPQLHGASREEDSLITEEKVGDRRFLCLFLHRDEMPGPVWGSCLEGKRLPWGLGGQGLEKGCAGS